MTRLGPGGPVDGGRQFVSWVHGDDVERAVDLLLAREDLRGPVDLCAPQPVTQRELVAGLRAAWGVRLGLPASAGVACLGAFALGTDTELLLRSRRVVPGRSPAAGFAFEHPAWAPAAADLARSARAQRTER